ncbi:MAG: hypothetical protein JF615_06075 [Asticcacaulis sp.]|nr:hypothetical protein [Asticcacaulis sp.]
MAKKSNNPWLFIAGGSALVVVLAIIAALALNKNHKDDPKMNEGQSGISFDVADPTLDPKKPLRCYVNGAYVADLTPAECAKKNGVPTGALDVGLDENGNATAAPTGSLAPVPGAPASTPPAVTPGTTPAATPPDAGGEVVPDTHASDAGPVAACLRFNSNSWNKLSDGLTLGQCVKLLYDGRCVSPGNASYGRCGDKTLRLVPRRVEISDDNTNFRSLVETGQGCSVPMVR